jgi:hypothetical protein
MSIYKVDRGLVIIAIVIDVPSDQKENKTRVLPHLLFYRKVCLTLTGTHMYLYLLCTIVLLVAYLWKNVLKIN